MEIQNTINKLKKFRLSIYSFFTSRRDTSMELVDALSSNLYPQSVVSVSLVECYRRNYCSITRTLDEFYRSKTPEHKTFLNKEVSKLLYDYCPTPKIRKFYLFGVDCTPAPRVHAPTLEDRGMVHQSTPIPGQKPITVGHEYSIMACLPEKTEPNSAAWVWPLSCHRVTTEENAPLVGMKQFQDAILSNDKFKQSLCVTVADSAYSNINCIKTSSTLLNQVHISRLKNNRVLYRAIKKDDTQPKKRGRPKIYGDKFILSDEATWGKPNDQMIIDSATKKGKPIKVHITCWNDLLMREKGKAFLKNHPLRVANIKIFKENGELLFKKPLWSVTTGKRRFELSLQDIYESYRQRFDLEHFFRFGKNRLLMDKSQTSDVTHEEAWWQIVLMAYAQLYLAKTHAQTSPSPWEKYLPEYKNANSEKTPTQVQRDFGRIIREFGTPAMPPKPRKKSKGRQKGEKQVKRIKYPIVIKNKKDQLTELTDAA